LEPAKAFGQEAPRTPDAGQGSGELQNLLRLAPRLEPGEDCTEVVVLALEPVEPGAVTRELVRVRISLLGEREKVVGEAAAERPRFAGAFELLGRVFTDRLEHPETIVAVTKKALVDERLERVEVRVGDLLGRLEGAAAAEHGQPGE